jgi:hypothetical protein
MAFSPAWGVGPCGARCGTDVPVRVCSDGGDAGLVHDPGGGSTVSRKVPAVSLGGRGGVWSFPNGSSRRVVVVGVQTPCWVLKEQTRVFPLAGGPRS